MSYVWMMADNAKEALEQWQMSAASKVCLSYYTPYKHSLQSLTVVAVAGHLFVLVTGRAFGPQKMLLHLPGNF